jgi:pimeloyl-ACP methyl ester carboxylesterase
MRPAPAVPRLQPRDAAEPLTRAASVRSEVVLAKHASRKDLPALLFLQGGPGFPAGRPVSAQGGWLSRALETHRVFLLDQRGTGRSTPLTHESLAQQGSPADQAAHIALHRADNIVRDCEAIRLRLAQGGALGEDGKWTLLGQSFGGFCALSYLSMAPEGLRAAIFTGGLAPTDPVRPAPPARSPAPPARPDTPPPRALVLSGHAASLTPY